MLGLVQKNGPYELEWEAEKVFSELSLKDEKFQELSGNHSK